MHENQPPRPVWNPEVEHERVVRFLALSRLLGVLRVLPPGDQLTNYPGFV